MLLKSMIALVIDLGNPAVLFIFCMVIGTIIFIAPGMGDGNSIIDHIVGIALGVMGIGALAGLTMMVIQGLGFYR